MWIVTFTLTFGDPFASGQMIRLPVSFSDRFQAQRLALALRRIFPLFRVAVHDNSQGHYDDVPILFY